MSRTAAPTQRVRHHVAIPCCTPKRSSAESSVTRRCTIINPASEILDTTLTEWQCRQCQQRAPAILHKCSPGNGSLQHAAKSPEHLQKMYIALRFA